jgi:hypothetical protein
VAKLTVKTGSTSRLEHVFILDSASTVGAGKTGLTNASVTMYYFRPADTTATSVTLSAGTLGTWSSGGFKEVDATNMPGVYEVGMPNAVFAATFNHSIVMIKGTGVAPVVLEYNLVSYDPLDTVRLGLTALPNVAQGTSGAISTGNASGQVTVATNNDKTGYSLTQTFPTNFSSLAITAGGAVTAGTVSDKTGYSLTQTFPTNFSSLAITAGGAVTAGTVSDKTGYSLATAPPTAAQISTQVWTEPIPGTFAAGSAGAKLNSASSAGDPWATALPGSYAAGTAGNILGNRLDAAISTRSTLTATNVWSEALPGTYTSGQAGFKLNAAGTAADPWSTALPGSYGAGTAGNIIGNVVSNVWAAGTRTLTAGTNIVLAKNTGITGFNDITSQSVWDVLASSVSLTNSIGLQLKTNIDTTVSSRMATFTYTSPLTTAQTASAVWDALLASYTVNNSFGQRVLRSTTSQSTCAVTGSNHIAADVHNMQPDVVTASAVAADATAEIADRVLGRTIAGGADGGRTVTDALRILRNKFTASGTTLTVYAENDTTVAWTSVLSTDAGATPITGSDPA